MADLDRILTVKNAVEARLRKYPGVHAVGIGHKVTGGKSTGEMSIAIFVTEKRPLSDLQPHEVVPAEIDGIKTDVIEQELPRLLMAADPAALTSAITPPGLVLTFSGTPGGGLVVLVTISLTPPGGGASPTMVSTQTYDWYALTDIASAIAQEITALGNSWLTATASGAQVTLVPTGGGAASFTVCAVTAIDDTRYFKDFLRGGVQIQLGGPAGFGTLGWLTSGQGAHQGGLFGVTNHHVATLWSGRPTNLQASYDSVTNLLSFTTVSDTVSQPPAFQSTDPITPETIVLVEFWVDRSTDFNAVYSTAAGDTPATVAAAVMNAISGLGAQGSLIVSASPGPNPTTIQVSAIGGPAAVSAYVLDPPAIDPESELRAAVVRDPATATRHAITFTGRVPGDDYGIYLNIDLGGDANTFSVFLNPPKNRDLTALASDVATAISGVAAAIRGAATASASGATVTVEGSALLECLVTGDIRVGQPTNDFTCPCSHCCNNRIGRVVAVDLPSDTALISLDSGFNYLAAVEGNSQADPLELMAGSHPVLLAELGANSPGTYPVHKRGRTTHRTDGVIQYLNVSGDIGAFTSPLPSGRLFHRHYKNAMQIQSSNTNPFSMEGDSGSAVVNDNHEVVGILFGGGGLTAIATPVEQILAAYPSFNLAVAIPVPAGNTTPVPIPAAARAIAQDRRIFQDSAPAPTFEKRLVRAEGEISATPEGRGYSVVVRRHLKEVLWLVNHNRRVATVWHRNGGPQIVGGVLGMVQHRDRPLPSQLNGKPLAECLLNIQAIFVRYGSEALVADLEEHGPRFFELLGQTYNQVLAELRPAAAQPESQNAW